MGLLSLKETFAQLSFPPHPNLLPRERGSVGTLPRVIDRARWATIGRFPKRRYGRQWMRWGARLMMMRFWVRSVRIRASTKSGST